MDYPSVTQVLDVWSDFSRVPADVLLAASVRGTRVHQYIAARLQGLLLPAVTEDMAGYVRSWERWATECIEEVFWVERELVDPVYGYCGHPDAVVRFKGDRGLTLIDWKTPQAAIRVWEVQIAAYKRLVEVGAGLKIDRFMSVRPDRRGGRVKISEYSGNFAEAFGVFLGTLGGWKFFNQ